MRPTLYLLLWLLATACCVAQQQEEKLINRLLDGPSKKFANSMGTKSFEGTADLKVRGAEEQKSKYKGTKQFAAEDYSTRSFFGVKNPWFGNKVFDTKSDKDLTKKALNDARKSYKVDAAETREFAQANKSSGLTETPVKTQTAEVKGSAQGSLDATKKNLSIDEVREILNKNH